MRLKHIKLAGFKSFVDPTTVPFKQQMTAIVGPNGCGKSNIIDAVRWVLGESSAKNLRGDAMTDVIFNGAATRKPIGQASVELVFDNVKGRLEGNMADRNEISIRRLVNRDSTNTYFLNGTKCRRKDITDIFLGTGLGPRSYAIIEQGTISRLIESKPHELRVFIEEAAGVSKYKERRKETENRIGHTRENLSRLSDIRLELSLQIDKLYKQSEAAKRFRTLKAQERKYKAELSILRWQVFDQQSKQQQALYSQAKIEIEALGGLQKEQAIELFQEKQKIELVNNVIAELNQQKIALTNDIARTEQKIKDVKQQSANIQKNNNETQQQLLSAQNLLKTEQEKSNTLENNLTKTLPHLNEIEKQLKIQQNQLDLLSNQQNEMQILWSSSYQQVAEIKDKKSSINNKIQLEEQKKLQSLHQIDLLNSQLQSIENQYQQQQKTFKQTYSQTSNELERALKLLLSKQKQLNTDIGTAQAKSNETKQYLASNNASLTAINNNISNIDLSLSNQKTWQLNQHASLFESDVLDSDKATNNTVQTVNNNIKVTKGWERAVESLLHYWMQAEIVDSMLGVAQATRNLDTILIIDSTQSKLNAVAMNNKRLENKKVINSINEKIENLPAAFSFLSNIYIADSLEEAQVLLAELNSDESVICADTTWLGHGFIRKGTIDNTPNYLYLHNKKQTLLDDKTKLVQSISVSKQKLNDFEANIKALLVKQNQLSKKVTNAQQLCQLTKQAEALIEQHKQFYCSQHKKLMSDIVFQEQQLNTFDIHIKQFNEACIQLKMPNNINFNELKKQQENLVSQVKTAQQQVNNLAEERHNIALKVQKIKGEKEQYKQSIKSIEKNIEQLITQQSANQQIIAQGVEPLKNDENKLFQWLTQMSELDTKIITNQSSIADTQDKLKTLELVQSQNQHHVLALKENAAKFQIAHENLKLRAESCLDLLRETQQSFDYISENMPKNAKEGIWQAHIIRLSKDIERLGAINLAAIDEYQTQLTRKDYLDSQHNDLTLAISTLEAAIEKIDKESRQKFKNTFEQVNIDLKNLFPKVFGGGKAYLELTGTDMLDSGVTIMAQPPGKKNSTIHLLSGGEKALTALSLVFAIFKLNPAPFCMLDEVDAPLDDANVSRFCNLVREMSRTVQFIYISHNKIAMEMASHLTGVTMFEPGVSKMVAVDIEEAVALAEIT
mgnify:CR=1 FL=1